MYRGNNFDTEVTNIYSELTNLSIKCDSTTSVCVLVGIEGRMVDLVKDSLRVDKPSFGKYICEITGELGSYLSSLFIVDIRSHNNIL